MVTRNITSADIAAAGGVITGNSIQRQPSDYAATLVGPWIDPSDPYAVSGTPVERIGTRSIGLTAQGSTASRRPTINNGRIVFDGTDDWLFGSWKSTLLSSNVLPDIPNSEPGKGFTCTGLAKAPDGTWWVGNHGKKNEATAGGETFFAGVVHLSADFSTVLHDIRFVALGLPNSSAQGVTIEPLAGSDYNVWGVIADGADTVYKLSPTGALRGSFTYALPNGIAFDIARDKLIICKTLGQVDWVDKTTGVAVAGMTMRTITDSPDGLWYDQAGSLYLSGGPNGAGGLLIKYDVATKAARKCWVLDPSRSIEHLHIDAASSVLTVVNDAYFHNSGNARYPALNTVQRYQLDTLASPDIGTRFVASWTGSIAAQPASTKALIVGSNPSTSAEGVGIGRGLGIYYTATTNEVRFTARIGGVDSVSVTWVVTDVTAEANFELVYNSATGRATLYQNGVTLGEKTGLPVGTIPAMMWTIGCTLDNTGSPANFCAAILRSLFVAGA